MNKFLEGFADLPAPMVAGIVVGIGLICIGCYTLHKWDQNPEYKNFTLFYCVANKDGFPDNAKIREWGAYFVSSYGFLWMLWSKQMTEWYFVGYMGAWVLAAVYSLKKRSEQNIVNMPPNPSPEGTVNEAGPEAAPKRAPYSATK